MKIEILGKINELQPIQSFASGFYKRTALVEIGDKYPQVIPVEFMKEKSDLLKDIKMGAQVNITANLRGSEYNGKHYLSLNAQSITSVGQFGQSSAPTGIGKPAEVLDEEDLPF